MLSASPLQGSRDERLPVRPLQAATAAVPFSLRDQRFMPVSNSGQPQPPMPQQQQLVQQQQQQQQQVMQQQQQQLMQQQQQQQLMRQSILSPPGQLPLLPPLAMVPYDSSVQALMQKRQQLASEAKEGVRDFKTLVADNILVLRLLREKLREMSDAHRHLSQARFAADFQLRSQQENSINHLQKNNQTLSEVKQQISAVQAEIDERRQDQDDMMAAPSSASKGKQKSAGGSSSSQSSSAAAAQGKRRGRVPAHLAKNPHARPRAGYDKDPDLKGVTTMHLPQLVSYKRRKYKQTFNCIVHEVKPKVDGPERKERLSTVCKMAFISDKWPKFWDENPNPTVPREWQFWLLMAYMQTFVPESQKYPNPSKCMGSNFGKHGKTLRAKQNGWEGSSRLRIGRAKTDPVLRKYLTDPSVVWVEAPNVDLKNNPHDRDMLAELIKKYNLAEPGGDFDQNVATNPWYSKITPMGRDMVGLGNDATAPASRRGRQADSNKRKRPSSTRDREEEEDSDDVGDDEENEGDVDHDADDDNDEAEEKENDDNEEEEEDQDEEEADEEEEDQEEEEEDRRPPPKKKARTTKPPPKKSAAKAKAKPKPKPKAKAKAKPRKPPTKKPQPQQTQMAPGFAPAAPPKHQTRVYGGRSSNGASAAGPLGLAFPLYALGRGRGTAPAC